MGKVRRSAPTVSSSFEDVRLMCERVLIGFAMVRGERGVLREIVDAEQVRVAESSVLHFVHYHYSITTIGEFSHRFFNGSISDNGAEHKSNKLIECLFFIERKFVDVGKSVVDLTPISFRKRSWVPLCI